MRCSSLRKTTFFIKKLNIPFNFISYFIIYISFKITFNKIMFQMLFQTTEFKNGTKISMSKGKAQNCFYANFIKRRNHLRTYTISGFIKSTRL